MADRRDRQIEFVGCFANTTEPCDNIECKYSFKGGGGAWVNPDLSFFQYELNYTDLFEFLYV